MASSIKIYFKLCLHQQTRLDIHEAAGKNIKRHRKNRNAVLIVGIYPQQMLKWGIEYCWKTIRNMIERVESFPIDD